MLFRFGTGPSPCLSRSSGSSERSRATMPPMRPRRVLLSRWSRLLHQPQWSYHSTNMQVSLPLSTLAGALDRLLPSFCFQLLPTVKFLNSFVFKFLQQCRGCTPSPFPFRESRPRSHPSRPATRPASTHVPKICVEIRPCAPGAQLH